MQSSSAPLLQPACSLEGSLIPCCGLLLGCSPWPTHGHRRSPASPSGLAMDPPSRASTKAERAKWAFSGVGANRSPCLCPILGLPWGLACVCPTSASSRGRPSLARLADLIRFPRWAPRWGRQSTRRELWSGRRLQAGGGASAGGERSSCTRAGLQGSLPFLCCNRPSRRRTQVPYLVYLP